MIRHAKKTLRPAVDGLLHRFGLWTPPAAATLDTPIDAIYAQRDLVFEVPVSKCFYPYQFGYGPEGWNPFVRTLRQYADEQSLTYDDSLLAEYYRRFTPQSVMEIFFERPTEEASTWDSILWDTPAHSYAVLPWSTGLGAFAAEKGLDRSFGYQGYGPVKRAKGKLEFQRLVETYESIRERGYRPSPQPDGEIRGYFLRSGTDYRFVVRAGFHRTAALAALGHASIRVKFMPHRPRSIDLWDIGNWPMVKQGVFPEAAARAVFCRFFEQSGRDKARNLGLV